MLAWLSGRSGGEVGSEVLWQDTVPGAEPLAATLIEGYAEYLDAVQSGAPPEVVLAAFERRRVLCAVREGEQGTARLNALLTEQFLALLGGPPFGVSWYAGRPVLITANDYTVRVFNGDVGVALPGPGGRFLVHFPHLGGGTRPLAPSRLPEHETAFAMTIHKAQGSEFERVEVVLPARDSRVLTRELLYTALTRARSSVRLWAEPRCSATRSPDMTEGAVGSLGGARRVRPVLSAPGRGRGARDPIARRSPEAPLGLREKLAVRRVLSGLSERDGPARRCEALTGSPHSGPRRSGPTARSRCAGPAGRAVALGTRPLRRHRLEPSSL